MEESGDNITLVSAIAVQPEGVAAGQIVGTTGKIMNTGLDKLEGKPTSDIVIDALPSIVLDIVGGKVVDKVTENGVIQEHAEAMVNSVIEVIEEKITESLQKEE